MPRAKSAVTQAEVARYFKAVRDAGFDRGRVEIDTPDGTRIRVVAGKASDDDAAVDDIDDMIERLP